MPIVSLVSVEMLSKPFEVDDMRPEVGHAIEVIAEGVATHLAIDMGDGSQMLLPIDEIDTFEWNGEIEYRLKIRPPMKVGGEVDHD